MSKTSDYNEENKETGTVTVLLEPVKASSDKTLNKEIIEWAKDKSSRKVMINCRTQSKC